MMNVMPQSWYVGNAAADARGYGGWFLGPFIDRAEGVRHTDSVDVRWDVHPAGRQRANWIVEQASTTMNVLISGRFSVYLNETVADLIDQGDYVVFDPGTCHAWQAHTDSVVLTVRWPALRGESGNR